MDALGGVGMNIIAIVKDAKCIGISGHVRPDGDCIGSCLALRNYLLDVYPEKEIVVYLEKPADKFMFLKGISEIKQEIEVDKIHDVFFSLDAGEPDRLGFSMEGYQNAKVRCCIDHHISNTATGETDYVVPTASSTCELIYNLIPQEALTKEIGECLYVGISHDTGVFQYSNVKPSTMRAAAKLLELGVNGSEIIESTFYEKTYTQNRILGKALLESQLYCDGKVIAFGISQKEMQEFGVKSGDMSAIVSQLRNTQGVDVAIFLYENRENEYKVSLRSNDNLDCNQVANTFQGGGHKKAAGCMVAGTCEEILERVLAVVDQQFTQK